MFHSKTLGLPPAVVFGDIVVNLWLSEQIHQCLDAYLVTLDAIFNDIIHFRSVDFLFGSLLALAFTFEALAHVR